MQIGCRTSHSLRMTASGNGYLGRGSELSQSLAIVACNLSLKSRCTQPTRLRLNQSRSTTHELHWSPQKCFLQHRVWYSTDSESPWGRKPASGPMGSMDSESLAASDSGMMAGYGATLSEILGGNARCVQCGRLPVPIRLSLTTYGGVASRRSRCCQAGNWGIRIRSALGSRS